MLLPSEGFVTLMLGTPPPPLHPIIHTKIPLLWSQCSDVFWKLRFEFKSSYNVYGYYILKAKISLILQHFFFLPFPKFTTPAHAPFKKSYRIYYGLIGNYPSFKMIPNATYILFLFKKNIIDKIRACLLCVLGIYIYISLQTVP